METREDVWKENAVYKCYCAIWDLYGPRKVVCEILVATARPESRVDVDAPYASELI